jgi:arginine/lysine/ornithine decarboxylase
LADVCHSHGVPLLVDEAHGAHLGLHPGLPPSALQCGADLAVQSTHKQLSAMTQAAMLHVRGQRVARERLARSLQVLQSSSPSYLLMSSLDAARAQASSPQAHEQSLAAASYARQPLAGLLGVQVLSAAQAAQTEAASSSSASSGIAVDPLRLTLSLQQLGLTGYQAAAALQQQHGIVPELATPTCVVLALSIGSTVQHAQALVAALQLLCKQHGGDGGGGRGQSSSAQSVAPGAAQPAPEVSMAPRDAFYAAAEVVPADEAVGRVSADLLCPYPPGVPAAYPGEVITAGVLQQLQAVLQNGDTVTGCSDASLCTLRVVVLSSAAA